VMLLANLSVATMTKLLLSMSHFSFSYIRVKKEANLRQFPASIFFLIVASQFEYDFYDTRLRQWVVDDCLASNSFQHSALSLVFMGIAALLH